MATKKNIKSSAMSGETFASLQISKNSDSDMEQKLQLLYKLQKTDSKIDAIYMLRGELPLEVQDLEDEVVGLKAKISSLQKEIKDIEAFISEKEHEMEAAKATIKKYEQQRNNVKNNREFDSLSKEIEYQELESKLAEKRKVEGKKNLVTRKEELEIVKGDLVVREDDLKAKRKELDNISKETEKEEAELLAQSKEYQEKIEPRMLSAYEKVRSNSRNKMAVVTVVRGACGGCYNKIPPQRQIDIDDCKKIIVCEYCGRILVSQKFDEELAEQNIKEEENKKARRATAKKKK